MENENINKSETILQEKSTNDILTEEKPETRCKRCQALLEDWQVFCPECGEPLKRTCQTCGEVLGDNQSFCPKCGTSLVQNNISNPYGAINNNNIPPTAYGVKNTNKINIISVILVLFLFVMGVSVYFIVQNKKVSQYKTDASDFCTTVLLAASNLEGIGNEIQTEWHDYIWNRWSRYNSIDEAVAGALSNKSSEINNAKQQKTKIDGLYSKLRKPVNNSDELKDICDAVKELYKKYDEMYDCVTSPSGNYNSFKSDFADCDSDVSDAYNELKDICDNF